MKNHSHWIGGAASLAAALATLSSAKADTVIASFDTFTPNALYASWATATINATPTNYIISDASKYGSLWKQIGLLNAAGNTNLVFDVTITAANPAAAASALTVIVDLKDGQSPVNTQFSYRFQGLGPGHHVLVGNLFSANVPATDNGTNISGYQIVTNTVNPTTQTLDLSQLWHLNVELDPTTYTNVGYTYTIALNDLTLTGSGGSGGDGGGGLMNVCATLDSFDNSPLGGLSGNWTSQVSTPTNLQITAIGYGDGWAAISSCR